MFILALLEFLTISAVFLYVIGLFVGIIAGATSGALDLEMGDSNPMPAPIAKIFFTYPYCYRVAQWLFKPYAKDKK